MATAPPRADAVLVRRLRERDRTAWDEVYAVYGPRLRAFAYRLAGNGPDADDLVQETFVRALPRLDRLDPQTVELGPYLFTTLRNLFLKHVERGRRVAPVEVVPEPDVPAPIEDDPERSTLLHRQQEEVRLANARLAPRQRLVLALRELEDRSYAEIGELVGLNENAVAQLISRARESLRAELRLAQVDPERLPEECRRRLPLLSQHLDGRLRGSRLEATLAHLESCERCQDALASMREAQRRYRAWVPPVGDSEAHAATVDARLVSARYWEGRRRLRSGGAALVAAAVALLVTGGAGVGAAVLISGDEPVAVAAATSSEARTTTAPRATGARGPTTVPKPTTTAPAPPATTTRQTTAETPPTRPAPTAVASTAAPPSTITARPATTAPPPPSTTTTPTAPRDTTAPTVNITARPPTTSPSADASFAFRAREAGAVFFCRLDGSPFSPCTSPARYRGLAPGAHAFAVRARDRAGNTGAPVVVRWAFVPPDTMPPTVTITAATARGGDAAFSFTASEPGTFACSLDGAPPEPCGSPKTYAGLAPGSHVFAVYATDAAGNTGAAVAHAWTIEQPLPDLVVSALTETSFTVTNTGAATAGPFVVTVTLAGTFSFRGLAPGESATRTWSVCRRGTLTAVADRGGDVVEADERNNTRTLVSDC